MRIDHSRRAVSGRCSSSIVPVLIAASIGLFSAGVSADLLELTYVPPYGSTENLAGHVHQVDPDSHRVAVYIFIEGLGWFTKPYLPCRGVPILSDSSWTADITTAINDEYATVICVFLVPDSIECLSIEGDEYLPDAVFEMCVDAVCTTRVARTISFSGYEWAVRKSYEPMSPDSNYFSDSTDNVWVDGQDRLHLAIRELRETWFSSEVVLDHPLGYGMYLFQVDSKIGDMNENIVLGMFTFDSEAWAENHREMDIEFSQWGDSSYPNAQFVVQPWEEPGNIYRWVIPPELKSSTHGFYWTADSVRFVSARGHQSAPPFDSILNQWTYTSTSGIPEPGDERVTLNLWLFRSSAPSDSVEPEVIISSFRHFTPTSIEEREVISPRRVGLLPNRPNPFRSETLIGYSTGGSGRVTIRISDVSGRVVRTLLDEERNPGDHYLSWDARDNSGQRVKSGVYFSHLQAGAVSASRKMVLVR